MTKTTLTKSVLVIALLGLVAVPAFATARNADDPLRHIRTGDFSEVAEIDDNGGDRNKANKVDDNPSASDLDESDEDAMVDGIKVENEDGVNVPEGSVAMADARATAQAVFPDSTIFKVEIELEDGIVVYSFRFTDKARVDVSTTDGSVVRTEQPRTGETERSGSNSSDDNSDDSSDSDDDSDDNDDNSGRGSDDD